MDDKCTYALHLSVIFCFLLSTGLTVSAVIGHTWWKYNDHASSLRVQHGITKECVEFKAERTCKFRSDIFEFAYLTTSRAIIPDIILLLCVVAVVFGLGSLVASILILCCLRKKRLWKCSIVLIVMLALLGGLSNLGGMIYSELSARNLNGYSRDISTVLGWLGVAFQLLGVLVLCILTCFPPRGQDGGVVTIPETPSQSLTQYYQSPGTKKYQEKLSYRVKPFENRSTHIKYYANSAMELS